MKRFTIATVLCSVLVVAMSVTAPAATRGGTISGAIDSDVSPPYGSNALSIESEVVVTVRDAAGTAYGTMSFGKPIRDDATNVEHVPFTISGLPINTPLTVGAGPHVAANATPVPRGFFMTFTIRKEHGAVPPADYAVTLTPSAPRATGIDFTYAALEVPPALQQPAPVPSTSPAP